MPGLWMKQQTVGGSREWANVCVGAYKKPSARKRETREIKQSSRR